MGEVYKRPDGAGYRIDTVDADGKKINFSINERMYNLLVEQGHIKPNNQNSPGPIGNTVGLIVPKTLPWLTGGSGKLPPDKAQTEEEQIDDEARALMLELEARKPDARASGRGATFGPGTSDIKDQLEALAYRQEQLGGVKAGTALGDYRQAVGKEVFEKGVEAASLRAGGSRGAKPTAQQQAQQKNTPSTGASPGGYVTGPKPGPCIVGPYNSIKDKCGDGQQAHHIVADKTFGTGNRKQREAGVGRSPGMPGFNGPAICLQGQAKTKGTEHNTAHQADKEVAREGNKTTNGPVGTAPVGEIIKIYEKFAIAARPECKDQIKNAVKDGFKDVDKDQSGRTTDSKPKGDAKQHLEGGGKVDNGSTTTKPVRRKP